MFLLKWHAWLAGTAGSVNYYIDEAAMEIEEKNIFTAVEIITLIPMKGEEQINRFSTAEPLDPEILSGFRAEPAEDTRISMDCFAVGWSVVLRPYQRPGR